MPVVMECHPSSGDAAPSRVTLALKESQLRTTRVEVSDRDDYLAVKTTTSASDGTPPLPVRLEHVLILGMDYGLVLFTSDRGITPAAAAKLADEHGFATFYVPEHTHIPVKREAAHPTTGDETLPDDRYMRTLDPWVSLGTAAAVTSRVRLSTAVALPVEHDPITLAKSIATLDHLSGGRVSVGVGFGWNTDELADHRVPPGRRRTMLREYLEAMRALWTEEEASYDGEFVNFGPSWAWPKPIQSHIPVLVGAAGTEKNFKWIARSADGWITTPRDFDIDEPVKLLQDTWAAAGRDGAPQIVALDFKPDPDKLARWAELGVTEVLFGLPDRDEAEIPGYVERLAGKLAAVV
jgi:probable F420-dependent oxidoreductase